MVDLADELLDESEDYVTPDQLERTKTRLRQALNRMKRDGLVTREGGKGGPKVRWALRWES